jgi:ammonium transporter, Amt family
VIGLMAGSLYVFGSKFVAHVLKVDDPLDAVAVHAICGTFGVLCAGVFSHTPNYEAAYHPLKSGDYSKGWIYGGNGRLFAAQCVYCLALASWVLGHMLPFFFITRVLGLLRVDEAEERAGLDVSHHGGAAYETPAMTEMVEKGGSTGKGGMMDAGVGDSEAILSRCACHACPVACSVRVRHVLGRAHGPRRC